MDNTIAVRSMGVRYINRRRGEVLRVQVGGGHDALGCEYWVFDAEPADAKGTVVNGGGRGERTVDSLLGDALSVGVADGRPPSPLALPPAWPAPADATMSVLPRRMKPACTRKSHTRLVLFTSILTRSRASRRRSFPPRRAYSRTRVSLITRYGFGRMRNCEQSVCSSGVSRCSAGLFARLSGAARRGACEWQGGR